MSSAFSFGSSTNGLVHLGLYACKNRNAYVSSNNPATIAGIAVMTGTKHGVNRALSTSCDLSVALQGNLQLANHTQIL